MNSWFSFMMRTNCSQEVNQFTFPPPDVGFFFSCLIAKITTGGELLPNDLIVNMYITDSCN